MKTFLVSISRTNKVWSGLALGFFCAVYSQAGWSSDLQLKIEGVYNDTGRVLVLVLANEQQFKSSSNRKYHTLLALRTTDGKAAADLKGFPAGTYAVVMIHDENDNDELDTTFLGTPTEGYGFSNNPGKLDKQTFNDVSFEHVETEHTQIRLEMRYIK